MARSTTPYTLKEKFSLKDHLFNHEKVTKLANEIASVSDTFESENFIKEVIEKFPQLELKERIHYITDMLEKYIGSDFITGTNIIEKALPPELDPDRDDDDFGDFIYAPYGEYIMRHGQKEAYLERSFEMLEMLTKRFSMEFAIRAFFQSFKDETLKKVIAWSKNDNYHVRRFASEGSRSRLPWGMKIPLFYHETRQILDNLWQDPTTYVRRSVANHLHDISKMDPEYVFEILRDWEKQIPKNPHHFEKLVQHALRTLIKRGDTQALSWVGGGSGEIERIELSGGNQEIYSIGDTVTLSVQVFAKKEGIFRVGYTVAYPSEHGKIRKKIYTLYQGFITTHSPLEKTLKIPLIHRSTRKLAHGGHSIEITVDGKIYKHTDFVLSIPENLQKNKNKYNR